MPYHQGGPPAPVQFTPLGREADSGPLVESLAGDIRSRNEAAAQAAIAGFARQTRGGASSPLFQFLASGASSGAAGRTGAELARIKLEAAETGAARNLQRQLADQAAGLQAQQIANQYALGRAGVDLELSNLDLQRRGQDIQIAEVANRLNAGAPGFRPTVGGRFGYELLSQLAQSRFPSQGASVPDAAMWGSTGRRSFMGG